MPHWTNGPLLELKLSDSHSATLCANPVIVTGGRSSPFKGFLIIHDKHLKGFLLCFEAPLVLSKSQFSSTPYK